jgi:hypothetical protein
VIVLPQCSGTDLPPGRSTLVASEHELRVVDGTTEVARHPRSYDRGQRIETAAHLAALTAAKHHAHELRGRDRLRQACPHADAFLKRPRPPRGARRPPHHALAPSPRRVRPRGARRGARRRRDPGRAQCLGHRRLDQRARARRTPPSVPGLLPADPRARALRVTPHRLADYDGLLSTAARPEEPDGPTA